MKDSEENPRSRAYRFVGAVFRFARNSLAIVGLALVVYHSCFELSVVVSDSMAPTLQGANKMTSERDWVLSEKITYWIRDPRRWEVARFRLPDETQVAKRIVGLPGETVSVRDLNLVIDGSVIPHPASLPFLRYYGWGNVNGGKAVACHDEYFYLGDDSRDSLDSRFEGTIHADAIMARD